MILVVIFIFLITGCSPVDKWEGYIYPDRQNLMMQHNAGEFSTLVECEDACMKALQSMNVLSSGYYECGKNCKPGANHYLRSCDDSIKGNYYK